MKKDLTRTFQSRHTVGQRSHQCCKERLENWVTKLKHTERLHVRKCMKPDNFGKVVNVSLHHFSDASELCYGQCSYIRMNKEIGRAHCSLFVENQELSLRSSYQFQEELNAAVLSVKMACLLKSELKHEEIKGKIAECNKLERTLMCSNGAMF